ncbi:hydroxymethylbilane synthase [Ruicaihuangia caeni]|uniref:Porphobilinogen deaminase n=1 Tax=Ruicaihuangia caeni TaxID=3042517 RepID=A0AAW6T6R4_9MICO|nr:hydroxymethylbilane synthase [Klugiella sp. YN-L-19]MDI2098351.1 hydroxymethylbilane synthase [Klugiella sp. YN-L-19]
MTPPSASPALPATIRVGTRASALAMAQTRATVEVLQTMTGAAAELVPIVSEGDRTTASLASLGGTGVFAAALRTALLEGRCDAVVHSLKDLPTTPLDGLVIAATPRREDARDALCARDGLTLDTLPAGARVGTGSPRRRAQLLARRPDLQVLDIRGNVDSRLGRVQSGDLDAVVLSLAGLNRLGRADAVTEAFPLEAWPTAPGQGSLALEVRAGDEALVSALDDVVTRLTVDTERGVLARLEAGCAAPVGVVARVSGGGEGDARGAELHAEAHVYALDGTRSLRSAHSILIDDAERPAAELSRRIVDELLGAGAATLAPLGSRR